MVSQAFDPDELPKDTIYILGISGSPRNQATEYALQEALKAIQGDDVVTEAVLLRKYSVHPCTHCNQCDHGRLFKRKGRYCSVDDDVETIFPRYRRADGILLATPVYGGGVSAQLKCVLDRIRSLAHTVPQIFRGGNKLGGAITVAGSRHGGQQTAAAEIFRWFLWYGVMPVPGTSWECMAAGTVWSRVQSTLEDGKHSHVSGRKGAQEDTIGINAAKAVATNLLQKIRIVKAGIKALGLKDIG